MFSPGFLFPLQKFYIPDYNTFTCPRVFNLPLPFLVFLAIAVCLICLKNPNARRILLVAVGALAALLILIQTAAQWKLTTVIASLADSGVPIKQKLDFGKAYTLSHCAQDRMKGQRYRGELISDQDFNTPTPSVFRYELYPVIDLMSPDPAPGARICFQSPACKSVPEGFHAICRQDGDYIALRQGPDNAHDSIHSR